MAALGAEKATYFPHAGFVYSANKKSLVSGVAWAELSTAASAVVIKKVNEYWNKPQARQILFSILGEAFVDKYFDIKGDYKPHLLEVPYMVPNVRASLQEEFSVILANVVSTALADPDHAINNCAALEGYQTAVDRAYGSVMAEEGRIMAQTGPTKEQLAKRRRNHKSRRNAQRMENDVGGGTGRSGSELLGIAITTLLLGNGWTLDENETRTTHYPISIKNKDDDHMVQGSGAGLLAFAAARAKAKGKGGDEGADNLEDTDGAAGEKKNPQGDDSIGDGPSALASAKKDASETVDAITGLSLDDPRLRPTAAHQSDLLSYIDGSSLMTSKGTWGATFRGENRAVLRTVIGRCVPVAIRRFILKCRLFNSEHATLSASVIRRNMAINRISDSTKSIIDNLISRAATQTFLDLLRDFDSPRLRRQTICLLNQYYTYSGSQHPSHTCLTVPLVLTFSNQPVDGPFLVSMFDRMLQMLPGGGPSRKDTLAVSREIVDLLAESDGDLFLHLTGLVDRARHYQQTLASGGSAAEFFELATFIEPWVSTCLVGILRRDAVLFVWDQCFLTGWQHQFPKFCVDVLKIVSIKLMEVRSAPELKRTLMTLPRRVHTRNMRTQYGQRTKQYPKERNLADFWKEPALGKLAREPPREDDQALIEKLLAMTGGADELRRHADLEARKNEIETQRDIKEMARACERGLFQKARGLLEGVNIEASDTTAEGETFLFIAACNSHLKCVQLLLDAGADPNLGVISTGLTPLMGCVIGANTVKDNEVRKKSDETQACIVALVRAGASVNRQSTRTVLRPREMISAEQKEKELVRLRGTSAIAASVDEETDSKKEEDESQSVLTLVPRGSTALHMAVACSTMQGTRYYAHPLLVMTLVYCGADAKLINIQETTAHQILQDARHMSVDRKAAIQVALEMALPGKLGINDKVLRLADQLRAGVRMGQISQVRRVTKTVKSMDKQIQRFILNSPGSMGLHAKMLRDAGALANKAGQAATSSSGGKKDAWDRDQSKKLGSVQSIARDYPNLFERKEWEQDAASMLSIAAHQAHKDICIELVRLGASVNEGWPGPVSPLMCAIIGYGEDTDGPDANRSHAGTEKSIEVAQWLYENGALANVRSTDTGRNALHWAGIMGRAGMFEVLKTAGLLDDSMPDWKGVVPSSALAQALKKGVPVLVPNVDGAPLVPQGGHLDDFVEDVADEDNNDEEKDLLYVKIEDIVETQTMGPLRIPLVEWIEGVDEVVGTRNLIMGVRENAKKLSRVVKAIVATRNVDAKKAKRVCTEEVDTALMKKMPSLRDDRKLPILKARVKNNAGDNVVVKIRALIPGDSPSLANKLAKVTCERNGLPEKSIPKLVKALLAYSAKKTNYSAKVSDRCRVSQFVIAS
jgi:ankyrin repeat protein